MKIATFLIPLCLTISSCSETKEKPETLTESYNETEMDKAIQLAQSKVDEFISVLNTNDADSFSIKVPITDENGTEHFWVVDVTYDNEKFSGKIGNEPGIVQNVTLGQSWSAKKTGISDWMYMRGEMIHGGYTIDPLLSSYPKEKADALRSVLVR